MSITPNGVFQIKLETAEQNEGSFMTLAGTYASTLRAKGVNNKHISTVDKMFTERPKDRAEELVRDFVVKVENGHCKLLLNNGDYIYDIKNVGTIWNPAFFFENFALIFDRKKEVFVFVSPKVIHYTENYVLLALGEKLIVYASQERIECLGEFMAIRRIIDGEYGLDVLGVNGQPKTYGAFKDRMLRAF